MVEYNFFAETLRHKAGSILSIIEEETHAPNGNPLVVSFKQPKELTMTITVEISGSVATIILSEGIDYEMQDDFKKANKQALSSNSVTEIVVDFTNATFLDSAGIRALLILQKEADEKGKTVFLLNCNNNMRDIFEIGGFDQMFKFR